MSRRSPDMLFQLIHSLQKAEKRHFKLYIQRNSPNADLKITQIFDTIDKQKEYDEAALLKHLPGTKKQQLSNLKAHLYTEILAALRLLKSSESLDLQLNEQLDYAHILYKKGLFHQSLIIIERAKQVAHENEKYNFLLQLISLEKRIESLHITRSSKAKPDMLTQEAIQVSAHIDLTTRLSNLSIRLYEWYIRYGHALNEADEQYVIRYMKDNVPPDAHRQQGFYEQLYLFQSYTWYHFIRQNFSLFYKYAWKWVDLYNRQPKRKQTETGHYIKGLHYLLSAYFIVNNLESYQEVLREFERFSETDRVKDHENFRIQAFLYLTQAKINGYFMTGAFHEGITLVPSIEQKLKEYEAVIDQHRVLVLNYKIATLYFGVGNYSVAIDYLQKIINSNPDLRHDLQCYARVLHLFAHIELGNDELVQHLSRSVYRFMKNIKKLTTIEEELLRFLRYKVGLKGQELAVELTKMLEVITQLGKNRFETKTFAYLDVTSWILAKLQHRTMSEVIASKVNGQDRLSR